MFQQRLRPLVGVLLIVVCPSALLMAELPGAMLYAAGTVTLNGVPAAKSMSVFVGDRIDTADASVVSVNRSGSSLIVDPNSSVQYQSDGFTILKGTVRVRTSKGMLAHAGALSVIPKDNAALFDISRNGETVLVASREGTLTLTDGIETATLRPGYSAKVSLDPQDQSPKPAAAASGQDQGPKPAATTSGQGIPHKTRLLIVILASSTAALAVACILACGGSGAPPVSPVTP
jgi:hypothetical protein